MYGGCYYGQSYYGSSCSLGPVAEEIRKVLGCGKYDVYVLERGGTGLIADVPWTSVSWSRVLDDTSDGSVTALEVAVGCQGELDAVRPWRHELGVYRDGSLVWVGPVLKPQFPPDEFSADARDLSAWWDHRLIHSDHIYASATDLATIFENVAEDAMAPDNSPGLSVTTTPCGITAIMALLAIQHLVAATQLRDLTTTGVDWTVIKREVLAGGVVVPASPLGPFLDEHFAVPPTGIYDGTAQANAWLVRGSGGGAAGDTVYGYQPDGAAADLDGLLESVETVSTITDNDSALAAAMTRVALTSDVGTLDVCVLAPTAPFTIDQLVPGAECVLALERSGIFATYRLQKVSVVATAKSASSGGDGRSVSLDEQVALTFQPLGTV